LFAEYYRIFTKGSKPVQHLTALSNLSNEALLAAIPPVLSRLVSAAKTSLAELPE
jgi:putative ATP-dependent endonuclease of the OLD family